MDHVARRIIEAEVTGIEHDYATDLTEEHVGGFVYDYAGKGENGNELSGIKNKAFNF